jgi:HSP20 family molecular chaperone IbpA
VSAKWRRNKKNLKWLELKNLKVNPENGSKPLRIDRFGTPRNLYPEKRRFIKGYSKREWKEPKPLIDIFQEEDWVIIVAQIAGFNKETLKIDVKDQKLTLSARAKDRRYYKSLNLPKVVIPNVMHTTFKNGVLEIKLKKAMKEEAIKKLTR